MSVEIPPGKMCNHCHHALTTENSRPYRDRLGIEHVRGTCRDCEQAAKRERRAADVVGAVGHLLGVRTREDSSARPTSPEIVNVAAQTPPVPVMDLGKPRERKHDGWAAPLEVQKPHVLAAPLPPVAPRMTAPLPVSHLERYLIIPDSHHPSASPAYRVMLRAAQVFKPEGIIILGDFGDAASLSAHPKTEAGAEDFKAEVDVINAELDILDAFEGVRWKKYIEGNHEWRLKRYLANNARALMGLMNIQQLLRLEERGWDFIPYMNHVRIGKIHFTHDTGQAGVNAHRSARDIFMGSAVIGHTHRLAYEVRGVWGAAPVVTAMFGWLGDPTAITYVHQAAAAMWPHGFGLGYHDITTGLNYLVPVPIVNGTCVVEGTLIS